MDIEYKWNIVIGASAGGIPPLITLFDHTPLDGAAYFILHHIPINHRSHLQSILSRHSEMLIREAESDMRVENNVVYIPPTACYMTIADDRLHTPARPIQDRNSAIETFLLSVVADVKRNLIVVLLSGNGNDGIRTLRAVKDAGGVIIVQSPDTCEFPSMPNNAIRTGLVDFMAGPAEIPRLIHEEIIPFMEKRASDGTL